MLPPSSVYCFAPIISVSSHSASLSLSPLSPVLLLCSICRPIVSLSSVLFYSLCFPCLLFSPYVSAKHTLIISLSSVPLIVFLVTPLLCCNKKLVISFTLLYAHWCSFLLSFPLQSFWFLKVFIFPLFKLIFCTLFSHFFNLFMQCLSAKNAVFLF